MMSAFAHFSAFAWITYLVCLAACLAPLLQVKLIWSTRSAARLTLWRFVIVRAVCGVSADGSSDRLNPWLCRGLFSAVLFVNGIVYDNPSVYLSEAIGIATNGLLCVLILKHKVTAKRALPLLLGTDEQMTSTTSPIEWASWRVEYRQERSDSRRKGKHKNIMKESIEIL